MVQSGIGHGKTEAFLLHVANNFDYVALESGVMCDREELWEQLKQSLLEELAKRMTKPLKGRPAKGPGSAQLGSEAGQRIHEAYKDITAREGRPAQYAEVARRLAISATTLWRWRQHHAWPPEEGA